MIQNGLPVKRDWDKISQFTYEELHTTRGIVSEIFSGSESTEDKLYDIKDGMWDMIEKADKENVQLHAKVRSLLYSTAD